MDSGLASLAARRVRRRCAERGDAGAGIGLPAGEPLRHRGQSSAKDHEQLTDLATVFFGLGAFTANAAFDFSKSQQGWRTSRLGYLGEELFGYSLAYYAYLRGEKDPSWARALDANPRDYMRKGLRYLSQR